MDIRDYLNADKNGYYCIPVENDEPFFGWDNQVRQYPHTGPSGFSYFAGRLDERRVVDCLLLRDDGGNLIGILNHYPFDDPAFDIRKGDISFFVHPLRRNRGIGKQLLAEGIKRWNINLKQQLWTLSGSNCLYSYLKQHEQKQKSSNRKVH